MRVQARVKDTDEVAQDGDVAWRKLVDVIGPASKEMSMRQAMVIALAMSIFVTVGAWIYVTKFEYKKVFSFGVKNDTATLLENAKHGDAVAQRELGEAYLIGDKIEKNKGESLMWLDRASMQGDSQAQCTLGGYYVMLSMTKEGSPANLESGILLLDKAQQQGNAKAKELLNELRQLVNVDRVIAASKPSTKTFGEAVMEDFHKNYTGTGAYGDPIIKRDTNQGD